MDNENLKTIHELKAELQDNLHKLLQDFQRHPQIRGIRVHEIVLSHVDWHNGYDPKSPGGNPDLASGPDVGYRLSEVRVVIVLP